MHQILTTRPFISQRPRRVVMATRLRASEVEALPSLITPNRSALFTAKVQNLPHIYLRTPLSAGADDGSAASSVRLSASRPRPPLTPLEGGVSSYTDTRDSAQTAAAVTWRGSYSSQVLLGLPPLPPLLSPLLSPLSSSPLLSPPPSPSLSSPPSLSLS